MIPLPLIPKVVIQKDNFAVFEVEGLYPGYGVTLGSALRRVLLSSLEGAAITRVKIKGVTHEFSTIPNVLEDVVMILLNLKKLNFRLLADEPQVITLKVKGEKEVTGKDFKLTSEVKLSNPESKIATLTKPSAELDIEAVVEKGFGYEPAERREAGKSEVGSIPLDAIFTPVRKVSFSVDNMRVGKRTDFDQLKVEVETNGVISPQEAFFSSAEILVKHFAILTEAFKKPEELSPAPAKRKSEVASEKKEGEGGETKKMKVEDLKISERTKNALLKNNIKTAGGLARKSAEDILGLEGMGEKGVGEIKKALKKLGLELKSYE